MAERFGLDWRGDEVLARITGVSDEILAALAHQIEGGTKVNIRANNQIDTGFMVNSVYSITPEGSGHAEARASAKSRNSDAEMAPEPPVKDGAAVVVGAEYAIHQEERQAFLYPAGQDAARQAGGIIEPIAKKRLND